MAFVETNNNEVKFTLTNEGKVSWMEHGLLDSLRYFSISDKGVNYTLEEAPTKLTDMNGSHKTSTNVPSCSTIRVNK
jgi:hypothetical protein